MCSMTSLQSVDFVSFWGRLMHNPCCTDSFRLYLFSILVFPKFYLHVPTDHYLDMHTFLDMLEICRIFQRHLKLNLPCPALILIFLQTYSAYFTHCTKQYEQQMRNLGIMLRFLSPLPLSLLQPTQVLSVLPPERDSCYSTQSPSPPPH